MAGCITQQQNCDTRVWLTSQRLPIWTHDIVMARTPKNSTSAGVCVDLCSLILCQSKHLWCQLVFLDPCQLKHLWCCRCVCTQCLIAVHLCHVEKSGFTVRGSCRRYFGKDKDCTGLRWISSPKAEDDGTLKNSGNPFLHVQPGVPFQQLVPERPSRFPYPRKLQYLSNNGSSVVMITTSSISYQDTQHSMNLLEREEARKREVIHRHFLHRLKVKNGHDVVRRRSNLVLSNPAYRRETEPRVVARFRRIYSKSKGEGNSEPEALFKSPTRISTLSGDTIIPLTLFAMRLERYRHICLDACHPSVQKTTPILSETAKKRANTDCLRTQEQEKWPDQIFSIAPEPNTSPTILVSRCPSLEIAADKLHFQGPYSSMADQSSLNTGEIKQSVRRIFQPIANDGVGVGSGLLEASQSRWDHLSQLTTGTFSSITTFLSARWHRPIFYQKSKSRRYPQSLQTKIKVRDELSHILEEPVLVLDVNDTTALRAAGIDPEEQHPDPEAFFERQFAHFQEHGCFLQDDPEQPEQEAVEVVPEVTIPESEPAGIHMDATSASGSAADDQEESTLVSSPLRRAASAIGGCWKRSKKSVHGLIKKAKRKCLPAPLVGSTKKDREIEAEEEARARQIREICFTQTAMNGRRNTDQEEETEEQGEWVHRIPEGHGSIGQFECRWLDSMVE